MLATRMPFLRRRRRVSRSSKTSARRSSAIRFPGSRQYRSGAGDARRAAAHAGLERGAGITRACGRAPARRWCRPSQTHRPVGGVILGRRRLLAGRVAERQSCPHDRALEPEFPAARSTSRRWSVRTARPILPGPGMRRLGMAEPPRYFGLPAQCLRERGDAHAIPAASRRCHHRQYLRRHRRGRAPGAPDHPQMRRENPGAKIIVTGCAAQIAPEKFAALSEVDHVIGNEEKLKLESFQRLAGTGAAGAAPAPRSPSPTSWR